MFNQKEDKGIMLFIIIIAFVIGIKNYDNIRQFIKRKDNDTITIHKQVLETTTLKEFLTDSASNHIKENRNIKTNKSSNSIASVKKQKKHFNFDPNKISKDSIILLGFSSKVAYNWKKYLEKGGHFYSKKQLLKIYGLKKEDYNTIERYITIVDKSKEKYLPKQESSHPEPKQESSYPEPKPDNKIATGNTARNIKIEINTCTAEDLIKLRGIGQVLSKRIIKFRNKLGGFVSINQLKEVYGLPAETYESIKGNIYINPEKIRKIKINIEDKEDLKRSPYISYRLASQIVKYRNQHGYFSNKNDLLKIKTLDSLKLKKIEPYLDYARN